MEASRVKKPGDAQQRRAWQILSTGWYSRVHVKVRQNFAGLDARGRA